MTKGEIDRLGTRLRTAPTPDDLRELDTYREEFVPIFRATIPALARDLGTAIVSRHKSARSILDKLERNAPTRLSTVQDIAGARIIVPTIADQDRITSELCARIETTQIVDRRSFPTYGYRAVHVLARFPLPFEFQVRTLAQHRWAQLSERLADQHGFELKYGGGPSHVVAALMTMSRFVADTEYLQTTGRARADGEVIDTDEAIEALERVQMLVGRRGEISEALRIDG